jgi:cytochrome P450
LIVSQNNLWGYYREAFPFLKENRRKITSSNRVKSGPGICDVQAGTYIPIEHVYLQVRLIYVSLDDAHRTHSQQCEAWVKDVKARRATKESSNDKINTTIFDALLEHDLDSADGDDSLDKLVDQAFTFLVAGTDSTAYTMACATYYIIRSPGVLETLLAELDAAQLRVNGKFDWNRARRLTYLVSYP